MTHEELKKLLLECKEAGAFDMAPNHAPNNRATSFHCLACDEYTYVYEYVVGSKAWFAVKHKDECCLVRLMEEVESWEE